ncbi:hypothetical protein MMC07_000507 [Pseudocyphellaria aurata]|nr:hypothetical protein [Pseudocyphellaria aurata]
MPRTSSYSLTQDNLVNLGLSRTPTQLNLDGILTDHELRDLRIKLDQECLYISQRVEAIPGRNAIPVETITRLALYLSGPLAQSIHPGSTRYMQLQLQALNSSLALLHYNRVSRLHSESWSILNDHIADRFNDIVDQHREHEDLTVDKIRHFSSLYLVRLASMLASLFGRAEPLFRSLISPVFQMIFAGFSIALGQNANLHAISEGCDEILRLWQNPQTKYLALLGFQELIRLATAIRSIKGSDAGEDKFIDADALKRIMIKLGGTIRDVYDSSVGGTSSHLRDVLVTFTIKSPRFNKGYYFYGLLDCAAKLGQHIRPTDISPELKAMGESLLSISSDSVFRWKAIELHLAYREERTDSSRRLRRILAQRNPLMSREVDVVRDVLEHEDDPRLSSEGFSFANPDEILSTSTPISPPSTEYHNWNEAPLNQWSALESKFSSSVFNRRRSPYKRAGISSDCSSLFFYSDREVVVYSVRVSEISTEVLFVKIFEKKFGEDTHIWSVALSKNYLAVSTLQNVLVFRHAKGSPLGTFPSENFHLGAVALHETDVQLAILIGKSRMDSSDRLTDGTLCFEKHHSIDIPGHDYPKRISFGQNGKEISCITGRLNTVLIWVIDGELSSSIAPFVISNRYTPETKADGVTSSSVFTSPSSGERYVITTTSPSSERYKNGGEWPYSAPIGRPSESLPPDITHSFQQFRKQQALVAGAVSQQCNIFAVLEKTGNIFYVPLSAHSGGGIHSKIEKPIKLKGSLCKQDRPSPDCLRFDPAGTRLYAVDATGKITITTFSEDKIP